MKEELAFISHRMWNLHRDMKADKQCKHIYTNAVQSFKYEIEFIINKDLWKS